MQESDKINSTFKFNDMPIHNEIFDSYRLKREEIEKYGIFVEEIKFKRGSTSIVKNIFSHSWRQKMTLTY